MARIAIIGDFVPGKDTHAATSAALEHAAQRLEHPLAATWLPTDTLDAAALPDTADGVLVAPGSPYRDMERVLEAIRVARERGIPCLGTCGGFQHMILEYARNVLDLPATHAEYGTGGAEPWITPLACSLRGRSMELQFMPGSQVAAYYGATSATEQYYCNFGVAPERLPLLRRGPLCITGSDAEGEARVIELAGHSFFIGTLFVPQARSSASEPHPLVLAFVRACQEAGRGS